MKHTYWISLVMLASGLFIGTFSYADQNDQLQRAVNQLQSQIKTVQDSVPQQISKQAGINQKALVALQKSVQDQFVKLQAEIQQVQSTLTEQMQHMQKQIVQLSMMK